MRDHETQEPAVRWDTGEKGCGHLAMELANALSTLCEGQVVELVNNGVGAPIDIPAWCRLTGHSLISASHPNYVICKKGDSNV
jgi:tRNA 2-thiouridine synthesizing protein A